MGGWRAEGRRQLGPGGTHRLPPVLPHPRSRVSAPTAAATGRRICIAYNSFAEGRGLLAFARDRVLTPRDTVYIAHVFSKDQHAVRCAGHVMLYAVRCTELRCAVTTQRHGVPVSPWAAGAAARRCPRACKQARPARPACAASGLAAHLLALPATAHTPPSPRPLNLLHLLNLNTAPRLSKR